MVTTTTARWGFLGLIALAVPPFYSQPAAGTELFEKELKQRGLLGETPVVWSGELGPTFMVKSCATYSYHRADR